jgi:hypothetical protein
MAWFRTSELVWALVVASAFAFVNVRLAGEGSVEPGGFPSGGFGPARGWPFLCVAGANELGREVADSRYMPGGWVVHRNVFKSGPGYPHLAVNWPNFILNCLLAAALALLPIVLARRRAALRRKPDDATFPE